MRVRMSGPVDDATLRRSLEKAVGPENVRTDESSRRTYSTDASPCTVEPRAVAFVDSEADIRAVLDVCRALEVPITPRASGTSLSGAAIGPGVVLDTTRFHRLLEFDPERRLVRVEPGILLARLNLYLADRGMRFAPDPGSQELCRIGGMIGHNASGYRSVKYGQTRDHVGALKILLADGTAVDAHDVPVDGAEWRGVGGRGGGAERIWRGGAGERRGTRPGGPPHRQKSLGCHGPRVSGGAPPRLLPPPALLVGRDQSPRRGRLRFGASIVSLASPTVRLPDDHPATGCAQGLGLRGRPDRPAGPCS